ncbi:MAG: nuclear transport factor 2 family protein [Actinomycetota bacterium]|nr:nuclear transport factor 2 family protein [Actinomycetota bacterium]
MMGKFTGAEMDAAFRRFQRVSLEAARTADYNAWADLFTEDAHYVEHHFGQMHGREAIRAWIVPLMRTYPMNHMTNYVYDRIHCDEDEGYVFFRSFTEMDDPGDGRRYAGLTWTHLEYAGDGRWSFEEDLYNPNEWQRLVLEWLEAKARGDEQAARELASGDWLRATGGG